VLECVCLTICTTTHPRSALALQLFEELHAYSRAFVAEEAAARDSEESTRRRQQQAMLMTLAAYAPPSSSTSTFSSTFSPSGRGRLSSSGSGVLVARAQPQIHFESDDFGLYLARHEQLLERGNPDSSSMSLRSLNSSAINQYAYQQQHGNILQQHRNMNLASSTTGLRMSAYGGNNNISSLNRYNSHGATGNNASGTSATGFTAALRRGLFTSGGGTSPTNSSSNSNSSSYFTSGVDSNAVSNTSGIIAQIRLVDDSRSDDDDDDDDDDDEELELRGNGREEGGVSGERTAQRNAVDRGGHEEDHGRYPSSGRDSVAWLQRVMTSGANSGSSSRLNGITTRSGPADGSDSRASGSGSGSGSLRVGDRAPRSPRENDPAESSTDGAAVPFTSTRSTNANVNANTNAAAEALED
jgi:hypothetical protein